VSAHTAAPIVPRPGFAAPVLPDNLRSEWTKMRTLRSTWVTLVVTGLIVIGLSALITWAAAQSNHPDATVYTNPLGVIQAGWGLGWLAFEVLGVLVVTNEYSSGMIASTFLATPKRLRVLAAKGLVFSAVVGSLSLVMGFVNFYVGHAVLSAFPQYPDPALGDNNVLRAVLGMALTSTLMGLVGFSLGAMLRHTAGAITASVAVLFVLPLVLQALPTSWRNPVEEYWPTQAGSQLEQVTRKAHALSAWWGTGDLALFVAVLLFVASWLTVRRDA
jgi:ABC-2 type transport system permease protein